MAKRGLRKFEIAEAGDAIAPNLFTRFSFQCHLLDEELDHFPDGISWSDLTVNSCDSQLCFDGIEVSSWNFNFDGWDVPAFMPSKSWVLFIVNPFLHCNLNVQFSIRFIFFQLHCVFWLQNLKDLILIFFACSLEGKVTVHPRPLLAL